MELSPELATERLLRDLRSYLPNLKQNRTESTYANDVFEAVDDWCHLAQRVVGRDTRIDYPKRAQEETILLSTLQSLLSSADLEQKARYGPILEISRDILSCIGSTMPPQEGHLEFLKIVRERFYFLRQTFTFIVVAEEPSRIRFSSGSVWVEMAVASRTELSFSFGPEPASERVYWLDDILFMYGDPNYKTFPKELDLKSAADVDLWFGFVAKLIRQYGSEMLSNTPGIFDRLENAQAKRDAEYTNEMNLKHGVEPD